MKSMQIGENIRKYRTLLELNCTTYNYTATLKTDIGTLKLEHGDT